YSDVMFSCKAEKAQKVFQGVKALEPSASPLVLMVHVLVSHMLEKQSADDERAVQNRLMLRSVLEDGEFARLSLQGVGSHWVVKVEECLKAAMEAGEAVNGSVPPRLCGWFAHHLPAVIMIHLLPAKPVVDYGNTRKELVEQAVWFTLRGMGLTEETIQRYYNPKALELFTG